MQRLSLGSSPTQSCSTLRADCQSPARWCSIDQLAKMMLALLGARLVGRAERPVLAEGRRGGGEVLADNQLAQSVDQHAEVIVPQHLGLRPGAVDAADAVGHQRDRLVLAPHDHQRVCVIPVRPRHHLQGLGVFALRADVRHGGPHGVEQHDHGSPGLGLVQIVALVVVGPDPGLLRLGIVGSDDAASSSRRTRSSSLALVGVQHRLRHQAIGLDDLAVLVVVERRRPEPALPRPGGGLFLVEALVVDPVESGGRRRSRSR